MSVSLRYDLNKDSQLPPCEGPKLHAFGKRHKPVEFLELISDPTNEYDESGGHGYVFKVRINNEIFALKVVCIPGSIGTPIF